jgi:hypothetical protein
LGDLPTVWNKVCIIVVASLWEGVVLLTLVLLLLLLVLMYSFCNCVADCATDFSKCSKHYYLG